MQENTESCLRFLLFHHFTHIPNVLWWVLKSKEMRGGQCLRRRRWDRGRKMVTNVLAGPVEIGVMVLNRKRVDLDYI